MPWPKKKQEQSYDQSSPPKMHMVDVPPINMIEAATSEKGKEFAELMLIALTMGVKPDQACRTAGTIMSGIHSRSDASIAQ